MKQQENGSVKPKVEGFKLGDTLSPEVVAKLKAIARKND